MKFHLRRWPTTLAAILLLGCLALVSHAALATPAPAVPANPPWSANVRVDDDAGGNGAESPALAVGSSGTLYAAWRDFRHSASDAELYFSRSTNQGVTWTANITVSAAYANLAPRLAAAGPSTVHVTWLAGDWRIPDYRLLYNRSTDGGATWSAGSTLNPGYISSPADMAADDSGRVYVVWAAGSGLNVGRPLDSGATWVTMTDVITSGATGSWPLSDPALAIESPTGTLHLLWFTMVGTGMGDVWYARSTDQGQTWVDKQSIRQVGYPTNTPQPDIGVDPETGRIHAVWRESPLIQIQHASSPASPISWGAPVSVSLGAGEVLAPSIAAAGSGSLYVAWEDWRNFDADIYFSRSDDAGLTWTAASRVNDDATAQPQHRAAIALGGGVYAVWDDMRSGSTDIYASRILTCPLSLAGVTVSGPKAVDPGVTAYLTGTITPSHATEPILFTWTPAPAAGQGTAYSRFVWQEPGYYQVGLSAQNCGGTVAGTHAITVTCSSPVTGVSISGDTAAAAGATVTLVAAVAPVGARTPITYTWSPEPAYGQGTSQVQYHWHTVGDQTITVTAANCSAAWGVFSDTHTVAVSDNAPPNWSGFVPSGWVSATDIYGRVPYSVRVIDAGTGLDVSTARVSHYTGTTWSAWSPFASGSGVTTTMQTVSNDYNFGQDWTADYPNRVKFVITDTAGNAGYSTVYSVYLDTTPPTNPTVVSGDRPTGTWSLDPTIDMTWSGAADASSGVLGYAYQWSTSPATAPEGMDTTGSAASATLADGAWYLHVRAVDEAGWWAAGAAHAGPYKVDTYPPATPVIYSSDPVTGTWSDKNNLYVYFGGSSDPGGSGPAGYSYLFDASPMTVPDAITDTLSGGGVLSGPLPGGIYYLHVRARDLAGNWTPTVHHGPFLIDTTPPTAPVVVSSDPGLGAWSGDNTIVVTWTAATDNVGISGYSYQWDSWPSNTPSWVTQTAGLTATSPARADGPTYFHIAARDLSGKWSPVAHYGPVKVDAHPPSNPTLDSTTHAPGNWSDHRAITVTWSGASDGSGSGVAGCSYQWSGAADTTPDTTIDTSGSSASNHLGDGTWYFHLRTGDAAGLWSNPVHLGPFKIDGTPPSPPSSFVSTPPKDAWADVSQITVTWSGANDGGGSGVDGYSIEWSHTPGTAPDTIFDTAGTSSSKAVYSDEDWWFHIRARDKMHNWSAPAHYGPFRIDQAWPTCATTSPPTSATPFFTVTWLGSDAGSGVAQYELRWRDITLVESPDSVAWQPLGGVRPSYETSTTFSGQTGHIYQFQCRAADAVGNMPPWPSASQSQTGAADTDLVAYGIEVTQGIQDMTNSVPLITGKRTFVRFHVRTAAGAPATALPIPAELLVWSGGNFKGALQPSSAGGAITVRTDPQRANLDDSYHFEVPTEWIVVGGATFRAVLDPDQLYAESDDANNQAEVYLTIRNTLGLCLHVVPIARTNPPGDYFWVDSPGFWDIIGLAQRYYPVADSGISIWTGSGLMPGDPGDTWNMADADTWDTVLDAVKSYSEDWSVPPGCYRLNYYGMILPLDGDAYNGLGQFPGSSAIGRMMTSGGRWPGPSGGQTMAHEIGHNYGRGHVVCSGTEEQVDNGYPYPGINPCRIANDHEDSYYGLFRPVTTTVPVVIPPTDAADLMSYGNRRWISPYTYRALLLMFGGGTSSGPTAEASGATSPAAVPDGEYLYATGAITPAGESAVLGAFYRTTDPNPSLLQSTLEGTLNVSATYSLTLEDAGGSPLISYPFESSIAMGDDTARPASSFGLVVPWHPDTAAISIYRGATRLATRQVSASKPVVSIFSPAGGESIATSLVVAWTAHDDDPADSLLYTVRYSADDGATWQPLAASMAGTVLTVTDLAALPGSSQARVQVVATDGVNTGRATSERLTVARHAPLAHIIEPATGSAYQPPQPVVLRGAGQDAEDGTISSLNPSRLSWTSDISGTLGTGAELWLTTLPPGRHRITLTVTDSDGMTASDAILVTVGRIAYLPLVSRQ